MAEGYKWIELTITGMTCVNCQNKIERKLQRTKGIRQAKVNYVSGKAKIEYRESQIACDRIIEIIEKMDYEVVQNNEETVNQQAAGAVKFLGCMIVLFAFYHLMKWLGITDLFREFPEAEEGMGYGVLFLIGLLTSVHCIAMCGGINLGVCMRQPEKEVSKSVQRNTSMMAAFQYNLGRVISYTVIGGIIGALGAVISFTGTMQGIVQIAAGIFMVIMGLNMLNIFPILRKLQPRMPAFFRKLFPSTPIGRVPIVIGLFNGFMPCGPLQAMQIYALSTGSFIKGAFSMFLFSMGTVPLMFGLGAVSSVVSRKYMKKVMHAGAALVVVLGIVMLGRGFTLSGISAVPNLAEQEDSNRAKIENGVQMVTTQLEPGRYEPIVVQAGTPVRWNLIAGEGSLNGCNNRIMIQEYGIEKSLQKGDNIIEFTPDKKGTYTYSCWMGMIRSSITVVE